MPTEKGLFMIEAWNKRNKWLEGFFKTSKVIGLPLGFVCKESEIAVLIGIPEPFRDFLRKRKAMIVISPIKDNPGWTYSVEKMPNQQSEGYGLMLRTYESLIRYIKTSQIEKAESDLELPNMRMLARNLFNSLPISFQKELSNRGQDPDTVLSAIESLSA